MKLPFSAYIAWRYIRFNIRQSLIVALAVGIGVSIIIFIPSVNLSFFDLLLRRTVINAPHIQITREFETLPRDELALRRQFPGAERILVADETTTRRRNIRAYNQLLASLLRFPGVTEAAPYISEQVIIVKANEVRGVEVRGIIPELEKSVSTLEEDVEVGNLDTLSGSQIFLGWRLADELGVEVGDYVQLITAEGSRSFKVAGLINSGIYARDLGTALISLRSAQRLLDMPGQVTGISLQVEDIYQAESIGQGIARTYNVKSRSWMVENETLLEQITNFRIIIAVISFLIVFAAASSITSILIMVVASKSREIGILKAMGATSDAIVRIFLLQATFLSILGSLAGVLGGIGLIALYNITPFARAETVLGIGREPVRLNLEYTYIAVFYAMLSSILASIFPAWRAGKMDPVKAINQ